jgi:hypothetical protein
MKNLIAALLVTGFATASFARSIDITPVLATAQGHFEGLSSVTLLADARLQIVNEKGLVKTVKLSERTFKKLSRDILKLSNVEVKEVHNQFICMTFMAIMPTTLSNLSIADFNYETQTYGETRLVLTQRGCHMRDMTYPTAVHAQADALAAREELVILALAQLK